MTDHPTDDFDDVIRAAASDYNRPGETPRDRMWESIRAERARRAVPVRRTGQRRFWIAAVATAAVLVLGIAIGRIYEHMTTGRNEIATTKAPSVVVPDTSAARRLTIESPTVVAASPESVAAPVPVARGMSKTSRVIPEAPRATRPPPRQTREPASMAFRLAVVEHLAGTEAMLTSFRDEAARGDVDAQITTWARNLLTTTRLLQASAAQQDPTMKRLLDDLELVLVQIAQYSTAGPHRAEELELIEHSIERRGVIGKLRTNLPARLAPSGT
jgi:hypothetical protein